MMPTAAAAKVSANTGPRLFYQAEALSVIPVDSLCYTIPRHDELVARQHSCMDIIASLEDRIRTLEADLAVLEHRLIIAGLDTEEWQARAEIAQVKRGGFWTRNFGRCFWTGAVAGAAGWEWLDRNP